VEKNGEEATMAKKKEKLYRINRKGGGAYEDYSKL